MCEFFCTGNNTGSDLFSKGRKILYKDIAFGKEILFSDEEKNCRMWPFRIILSKKEKEPLILSLYCSRIVFIGSSFRMNATGEFSSRWIIGTQIP